MLFKGIKETKGTKGTKGTGYNLLAFSHKRLAAIRRLNRPSACINESAGAFCENDA